MKLLTVGDSFTYGEELADLTSAWPNLLATQLGYNLTNLAKPGSGNTRMVRHCIEQVNDYDLVIIAWSHFARFELADEHGFYDIWPGASKAPHKEYSPWRCEVVDYFNHHYNDDYLYRQYLLNIILIQNFFKANNKFYLMLDSFGNHQVNNRNADTNRDLLDQIDGRFYVGWPNATMMEWAYKTPTGPRGHFLELGHQKVADQIYKHMMELGWAV